VSNRLFEEKKNSEGKSVAVSTEPRCFCVFSLLSQTVWSYKTVRELCWLWIEIKTYRTMNLRIKPGIE